MTGRFAGLAAAALAMAGIALPAGGSPAAVAPPAYTVAAATAEPAALLAADEAAWAGASMIAWRPAPYETRFRAAWSRAGLFLRFDANDPSPWHTMTRKDEHLWDEEVVEIFLDPDRSGRDYYELEINALNTTWDLFLPKPYRFGGKAQNSWESPGMRTAVHEIRRSGISRIFRFSLTTFHSSLV